MVLDHDDFEAVGENLALNDLLQLGALAPRVHWSERQSEDRQSGGATEDTFSFGHVRNREGTPGFIRAIDDSIRRQEAQAQ